MGAFAGAACSRDRACQWANGTDKPTCISIAIDCPSVVEPIAAPKPEKFGNNAHRQSVQQELRVRSAFDESNSRHHGFCICSQTAVGACTITGFSTGQPNSCISTVQASGFYANLFFPRGFTSNFVPAERL